MATDDEDTNPRISVDVDGMWFRCTGCLHDVIADTGTRAPYCVACRRYMAPANEPRGQA